MTSTTKLAIGATQICQRGSWEVLPSSEKVGVLSLQRNSVPRSRLPTVRTNLSVKWWTRGKGAGFAVAHQTAKVVVTVLDGAQTRWKGSLEDTNRKCVLTDTVSFQKALCLHGNIWKGSSETSKGWLHRWRGGGIACVVVLSVLPLALWWLVVGVWCLLNHSILLFETEPLPKPETRQFKYTYWLALLVLPP